MEFIENEEFYFFGLVENVNIGIDFGNINVILEDKKMINIKLNEEFFDFFKLNKVYFFHVNTKANKVRERLDINLISAEIIYDYFDSDSVSLDKVLKSFYKYAPINIEEVKKEIENHLNMIDNQVLFDITKNIYDKFKNSFYFYPAAIKFHHNYIAGLAYHSYMMLKLSDSFIKGYRHLDKNYVYSGIILHDILKIVEFSEAEGASLTLEGTMIGHISLCANEIAIWAEKLGYQDKEEVTLLIHIILSHHGQLNFGSPKRPMIAEAFLISFLDNFDSKMTVLQEVLDEVKPGEYTEILQVMDKNKFYKRKDDNE